MTIIGKSPGLPAAQLALLPRGEHLREPFGSLDFSQLARSPSALVRIALFLNRNETDWARQQQCRGFHSLMTLAAVCSPDTVRDCLAPATREQCPEEQA